MFETRDLGIKCQQGHTLLFEEQVAVDMIMVCPQDVGKMLLEQARMVHWKKWAAEERVRGVEGGSVAGTNPSYVAKNDQRGAGR